MAVAKSGIGVLAILGRQLVDRRLEGHEEKHHHFTNWSRIAGSAAVLLIGLGLFGLTRYYGVYHRSTCGRKMRSLACFRRVVSQAGFITR